MYTAKKKDKNLQAKMIKKWRLLPTDKRERKSILFVVLILLASIFIKLKTRCRAF